MRKLPVEKYFYAALIIVVVVLVGIYITERNQYTNSVVIRESVNLSDTLSFDEIINSYNEGIWKRGEELYIKHILPAVGEDKKVDGYMLWLESSEVQPMLIMDGNNSGKIKSIGIKYDPNGEENLETAAEFVRCMLLVLPCTEEIPAKNYIVSLMEEKRQLKIDGEDRFYLIDRNLVTDKIEVISIVAARKT